MTPDNANPHSAPCGLYCGACTMYLAGRRNDRALLEQIAQVLTERLGQSVTADDLACDGCMAGGDLAVMCKDCDIRSCAISKEIVDCADCEKFACQVLLDFTNDGLPHHAEAISNAQSRKSKGTSKWARQEEGRWSCPSCAEPTSWYDNTCASCGTRLTRTFSLP